jgi:hypothetical protein
MLAAAVGASAAPLFETRELPPPKLRLVIHTQPNNNAEVLAFFVQFAREEGFTVWDGTPQMPFKDGRPVFNLTLKRGLTAEVASTNIARADEYHVWAYEPEPNDEFAGIATRLADRLKEKFPDTKPYLGR